MIIKVGDIVRHDHVYDGTSRAGKPTGPELTVTRIRSRQGAEGYYEFKELAGCDQDNPRGDVLVDLSDGSWAFIWNITKEV